MPKLIYCTTADIAEAHQISHQLLEEKLAVCVNIIPVIESIYRWKGEIESTKESVLFIKTVDEKVTKTIQRIKELHSYDVPEILVLDLIDGLPEYFDYLRKETL